MTQGVLAGSNYTATTPSLEGDLELRETLIPRRSTDIARHRPSKGASPAGRTLLGLADSLAIGIKLKLLFEIAGLYGCSAADHRERRHRGT